MSLEFNIFIWRFRYERVDFIFVINTNVKYISSGANLYLLYNKPNMNIFYKRPGRFLPFVLSAHDVLCMRNTILYYRYCTPCSFKKNIKINLSYERV